MNKTILSLVVGTAVVLSEHIGVVDYLPHSEYGDFGSEKISQSLLEAIHGDEDVLPVIIWTADINQEYVSELTEKELGYGWDDIYTSENRCINEAVLRQNKTVVNDEDWSFVDDIYLDKMYHLQIRSNSLIETRRMVAKEMYFDQNMSFAEKNGIQARCFFLSHFSPMVMANLSDEEIISLAGNEDVVSLALYEESFQEEDDISDDDYNSITDESRSLNYISYVNATGPKSAGINGAGVKVGLVDSRLVYNSNDPELSDANIVQVGAAGSTNTHAILMARIICGSNGLAPGCTLYSATTSNTQNIYEAIELLINEGVSIINYSMGNSRNSDYTEYEKWIDHIAVSHNVTFVKSAGNNGETTGVISEPGLAYNAITVASANYLTDTLFSSSSYDYGTGCQKPDVAAPGNGLISNGGTSAAAACTTGVIALMLHAKPSVMSNPAVIKAALMAGCDHNAGGAALSSGYQYKQGAGVINCGKSMGILSANRYYQNYTTSIGTITKNISVTSSSLPHSAVFVGLKIVTISGSHSTGTPSAFDMPTILSRVLLSSGSLTTVTGGTNASANIMRFTSTYTNYILVIELSGSAPVGLPYAIAWR